MQNSGRSVLQGVEIIKEAVFKKRPIFGNIIKKHGNKALYDYATDFLDINENPILDRRRSTIIEIARDLLVPRLGQRVANEVELQLNKKALVSTSDHHAIIDHPFWVNSNIITGLPYEAAEDPDLKYVIVFSFASVSLNNSSAFTRGLMFHGGEKGEGELIRLPILPDRTKMRTVYGTPPYTANDLDRACVLLKSKERSGIIASARAGEILKFISDTMAAPALLKCEDLSTQVTKINYELWPRFFAPNGATPALIYLEAESITREVYLREVLSNTTCLLFKMLFEERIRELVFKYFDGIQGTFSLKDNWGTYFFWGLDDKGHRVRLMVEEAALVSKEKGIKIPLTPEAISAALKTKKIFPSMMAVYLVVALHYGMKCLGGFSQVHDLTKMKEALLRLLIDLSRHKSINAVSCTQTKELGGDGLVLAYIENEKGDLTPATGFDLLLDPKKLSFGDNQKLSRQVSLGEIISPLLPEIYKVLYSFKDWGELNGDLTPENILKATGLQTKLKSLLRK